MAKATQSAPVYRYGVGEWYGHLLTSLSPTQRRIYADKPPPQPCPFKDSALLTPGKELACTKKGGVCSLRLYQVETSSYAKVVSGDKGALRTLCPYRFQQGHTVVQWIGETVLGIPSPTVVSEVGFLEAPKGRTEVQEPTEEAKEEDPTDDELKGADVGRIDLILLDSSARTHEMSWLNWCAVEMQAVYFSGKAMGTYFKHIAEEPSAALRFPDKIRRPDYRSSGPKRLMPQLQIKVPTLRRWGKKMAVVIDKPFFDSLGEMETVTDISNADIAWFIVDYEEEAESSISRLVKRGVRFTTLERAVEGLTCGIPVTLLEFERRMLHKLGIRDARNAKLASSTRIRSPK